MGKVTSIKAKSQDNEDIANLDDTEKLLQVRELLFGPQVREHDHRADDLQSQLEKRISELSNRMDNQLQTISQKLDAHSNAIEKEATERKSAVSGLEKQSSKGDSLISDLASRHESAQASLTERYHSLEKASSENHEKQLLTIEKKTASERLRIADALRKIADELSHDRH